MTNDEARNKHEGSNDEGDCDHASSSFGFRHSFVIRHSTFVISVHARAGTDAVLSSFPHPTNAPLTARRMAFQMT